MTRNTFNARPVRVGDCAPDFTLPDAHGAPTRLADLLGDQALVLYFYPKDDTAGCTAEACGFRDAAAAFARAGARVVGVSGDSVTSHAHFAARHGLSFPLLSDAHGAVRRRYGVPKTLGLLPGRVTYLIDHAGIVRHVFVNQLQATRHVAEALTALAALDAAGKDGAPSQPS